MLFRINWTIPTQSRAECYKSFAGMKDPTQDISEFKDTVKLIGRWHTASGTGGTCIADCQSVSDLNKWILTWAPLCDCTIEPMVSDKEAQDNIKTRPWYSS
tara:strand:+ start:105 stop:407 length:303 start_codon:yes stop_codon:yes gene_type:complete